VYVIRHTSSRLQDTALGPEDAPDVFEQSGSDFGRDERSPVLGGDDQVVVEGDERLRYDRCALGRTVAPPGLREESTGMLLPGVDTPGY
jgi:hypothetical protein